MLTSTGRSLPLSLPRRLACDLVQLARRVPALMVQRCLHLGPLVAAHRAADAAPEWSVLLLKAYAHVAARTPVLRQAYLSFPWPRLYEHPENVASVAVERRFGDEDAVFFLPIQRPEAHALLDLAAQLQHAREAPLENVAPFRKLLRRSRLPWPLRQWAWRFDVHVSGVRRARALGTFALSTVGDHEAEELRLLSPLTTALSYGTFGDDGTLMVRLTFDPRGVDASTAARALAELEEVLLGVVLNEMRYLEALRAA